MGKRRKLSNPAVKGNMLSISILIVLLCMILCSSLLFIGSAFYWNSYNLMVNQYQDSVKKQVSLYLAGLETEFSAIEQTQQSFLNNSDVLYLQNGNIAAIDFNMASALNRLISQIATIQMSNRYIKNLFIHLDSLERTLSTAPVSFTELDRGRIEEMLQKNHSGLLYSSEELHLLTLPFAASPLGPDFIFCVETVFDQNFIIQNLKSFHVSEEAQSILIFDDFEHYIATSPDILPLLENTSWKGSQKTVLHGQSYVIVPYYSSALHANYVQIIPEKAVFSNMQKLSLQFLFFASAVSLLTVIYCIALYRMIKKPVDQLINALSQVENENFGAKLPAAHLREFATIYAAFNRMTEKLKYLINNIFTQKILIQKADLRQLQAQINPHFLYNSFFILKKRINSKEYEEAKEFADMLGRYFKYVTKNDSDSIPLSEELLHAKVYADIQAIRFKDRLTINWGQPPPQCKELLVPRLILQPILENSFKYGLEDVEFDGILQIAFEEERNYLLIHVEDNSEGYQQHLTQIEDLSQHLSGEVKEAKSSGLVNIHRRLQLFFHDNLCGLELSQSELGGLRVTMRLPGKPSLDPTVGKEKSPW